MAKKILVVDDEPDVITFISIGSKDGVEGLELAKKERPDLILLDLMMPKKSGISMFQELRDDPHLSNIPIIVVTGVSEATGVDFRDFMYKQPPKDEKEPSGVTGETKYTAPDGYIEKPIDPDELIKLVEAAFKK